MSIVKFAWVMRRCLSFKFYHDLKRQFFILLMQIFLPLICYNHTCHTSYMMSIIKMMMIFTKEKINIALYPITFDSLINRARNAASTIFISS